MTDERVISIPLMWIPTIYNATDENRKKLIISQNRTMIIWDPEKSGINDEIRITEYLGPTGAHEEEKRLVYTSAESRKQIAEEKTKTKRK